MRVAVLDTGMDLTRPDFAGRNIIPASFVPGQTPQDGHSHGTHCIGTACGPLNPPGNTRRYGIAYQSSILVGKVLNNSGSGMQGWILAGINWAIQNRATVISMSLGSPVTLGTPFSPAYEQAAQAALNNGCLIVAAAGARSLLATRELSALTLVLFGAGFAVSAVAILATLIWMPGVSGPMAIPEPIRIVLFLGIGLIVASFLLPVSYAFADAVRRRDLRAVGGILLMVFLMLVVFVGPRR